MRVIRPIALAMVSAMEKKPKHPVSQTVQKRVNVDMNYGVKNVPAISVRSKAYNIDI